MGPASDEEQAVIARFNLVVNAIREEAQHAVTADLAQMRAAGAWRAVQALVARLPVISPGERLRDMVGEKVDLRFSHPEIRAAVLAEDRGHLRELTERAGKVYHAHGYAGEAAAKALGAVRWAQAPRDGTRRFALWDVQDALIRSAFAVREVAGIVPLLPIADAVLAAFKEQER